MIFQSVTTAIRVAFAVSPPYTTSTTDTTSSDRSRALRAGPEPRPGQVRPECVADQDQDQDQGERELDLDLQRDAGGPEQPPAIAEIVKDDGVMLADEPAHEIVSSLARDDAELEGEVIACDDPVELREER